MANVYADAESFVRNAIAAVFPDARVCTETPANLGDVLPVIQVVRVGGSDDFPSFDHAVVDVDVFAASRDAARDLADEVRTYLRLTLPTQKVDGAWALKVTTASAPTWTPYDNTSLRRFSASYRVRLHTR